MPVINNILNGAKKKAVRVFINPFNKTGLSWWQVRRLKNLEENRENHTPFLGGKLHFYRHNEFLHSIDEIFLKEIYSTDFEGNQTPYILDCGANIGMSVVYFKWKYPGSTVIAFEPDDFNYSYLEKNVKSMKLDNVTIKKEAVWIENTTLNFHSEGTMASRIEEVNNGDQAPALQVKAIRLKDLLNREVDMLKLDIEGAEYAVVKDIEEKLINVKRIFLEYHGKFDEYYKLEEVPQMTV
ncbi:FkbM family methyltransferase [Flavihumibacter solisilvae]|uniref:FkbM family methyltransferase n=1 Tax=Flavihumibacter solisilvae TaxID=1349421 RepID=UPI00068B2AE0|nr:FkbM family methyltransferase [Flavihumibacter solisilvae]